MTQIKESQKKDNEQNKSPIVRFGPLMEEE